MRTALAFLLATSLLTLLSACNMMGGGDKGNTVSGVLIDQACGSTMLAKDDPEKAAATHTRDCATKDACEKSGYAVITGKEMVKFDANGNKLAADWLAKTDKTDNLRVKVEGTRTGDTIAVTSLTPE